jgi:hypothetical protein
MITCTVYNGHDRTRLQRLNREAWKTGHPQKLDPMKISRYTVLLTHDTSVMCTYYGMSMSTFSRITLLFFEETTKTALQAKGLHLLLQNDTWQVADEDRKILSTHGRYS